MNETNEFFCPKCRNNSFKTTIQITTLDDFLGAVCSKCNYTVTEDDTKTQARDLADKLIRGALK